MSRKIWEPRSVVLPSRGMNATDCSSLDSAPQSLLSSEPQSKVAAFKRKQYQLGLAIEANDPELTKRLLASGASAAAPLASCYDCDPLVTSLIYAEPNIAQLLLDHGARTTGLACAKSFYPGWGVLHLCVRGKYKQLMESILDSNPGFLFVRTPVHPVHLAVLQNSSECLQLMLEKRGHYWDKLVCRGHVLNAGAGVSAASELVETSFSTIKKFQVLSPHDILNCASDFQRLWTGMLLLTLRV